MSPEILLALLQIIWIDILLSGDNAVVIALACRGLPPRLRRTGVILGAGAAVALRIVFAAAISQLLQVPYLRLGGGVLLLWIATKMLLQETEERDIPQRETLWQAVWTIVVADAVMSLDNVVAIAAVSKGNVWLFGFGLALSIPLIIGGATLIGTLLQRFPVLVWAGAGLLAWVAGDLIADDPVTRRVLGTGGESLALAFGLAAIALVLATGFALRRRARGRAGPDDAPRAAP